MEEEESSDMCQTCLVRGRFLYPLRKLTSTLNELGIPIKTDVTTGVCWECKTFIMKIKKFKLQVIKAQDALMEIATHKDFQSLSRLSCNTKYTYDLEILHTDPLDDIKTEINDIEVNKDEKNSSTKKVTKKELFNQKGVESQVRGKYTKIVFTEEEMLKNREEKRNQPNYKKIIYKCDSCVLGFTRKENYDLHVEKRHDENIGINICNICESRFTNIKALDKHRKKHYVVYKCKLCDYETLELWSMVNHSRLKHNNDAEGQIHCKKCSFIARNPEEMSKHVQSQHFLQCKECGDKFKGKNTLRTHQIRIHAVKREYKCDICEKSFKTKSRLESHIVTHNSTLARKLSFCTTCNVQYKNIYVFRNHLKNSANHSERTYECKECKKKFASKVYWRKHWEFYHLQKSQFKCEICNKLFISDWRLKNHRQTQHGVTRNRNHTCNICGKKFYTQSTLRGHQLTHSEERSYMCEDCGDTFKQRPALYTHSRLVHKMRPVTTTTV
ncbi:PREDICTED: zinc finger protein 585A-like [Papilio polytes]|uniref:zinc finger protein 585A-like n=1 Tax=Papilio polytes TaxID=76194 RepID=UPI0006762263|nr:PREDICTED: zinc finger protein 585A-like [Papilio polytes]